MNYIHATGENKYALCGVSETRNEHSLDPRNVTCPKCLKACQSMEVIHVIGKPFKTMCKVFYEGLTVTSVPEKSTCRKCVEACGMPWPTKAKMEADGWNKEAIEAASMKWKNEQTGVDISKATLASDANAECKAVMDRLAANLKAGTPEYRLACGIRYDLLMPEFLQAMAEIMAVGAKKYGEKNWMKGLSGENSGVNHAMKHLIEYQKGTANDYGPRKMHLAQVAVNAMFEFHFCEEE